MALLVMINGYFFLGRPFKFKDICTIFPPSLNEVLDSEEYPIYRRLLTLSGEDIEDEFAEQGIDFKDLPTPLNYVCSAAKQSESIKETIEKGFQFFIHEPVTILSDVQMIVVGDLRETLTTISSVEELRIINESNYFDFQNLIRQAIGEKEKEPYDPNEHPKVKYFKAKARKRDRIKAQSKESLTFGTTLATICCMGLGITPLNVGELSQCAITVLTRYYQEKLKYEIDIRSLLAGADKKDVDLKFWVRNLEDL